MALVLNGDGNITGLSVGGLPDATITSSELDTSIIPIGAGQTWTNVTGSRALGTTYTNSTGRPIVVVLQQTSSSGPTGFNGGFTINGSSMPQNYAYATNAGYQSVTFYIIPNGATYSSASSASTLSLWYELR